MTPTGKQHPRTASCLGAKVSLSDTGDPSSAPWCGSGPQMYISCAPAERWNHGLLRPHLFVCVLTRSFLLDQRNLLPVEALLKLIRINNQKITLWGADKLSEPTVWTNMGWDMFASDSNQSQCHCVLLLRFNGKSCKLWLQLASKKGICQASSATLTHVRYFISQVLSAILLDRPRRAALPCSSLPPAVLLRENSCSLW